jgi:hypothetical protein
LRGKPVLNLETAGRDRTTQVNAPRPVRIFIAGGNWRRWSMGAAGMVFHADCGGDDFRGLLLRAPGRRGPRADRNSGYQRSGAGIAQQLGRHACHVRGDDRAGAAGPLAPPGKWWRELDRSAVVCGLLPATLFWIVSNFGVWAFQSDYEKSFAGLMQCYWMAIPFFRWMLAGDVFYLSVLVSCAALAGMPIVRLQRQPVQA